MLSVPLIGFSFALGLLTNSTFGISYLIILAKSRIDLAFP